jgi:hypothetical protein
MVDECTVTRVTGPPGPVDPDTGEREPAPTATVYTGRCKVQTYEPHESARKSGEHIYIEQRYHLHLPISATEADVGDSVTVTSSATDAQLVGREYRVAGEHAKTWATARRLLLDEITG